MVIASRCFKHVLVLKPKLYLLAAISCTIGSSSASLVCRFLDAPKYPFKNNCMTYIPVGLPLLSPLFATVSKTIGNRKSLVTRASGDEDEVLNRILVTAENDPKSAREMCTAYINKMCRAGNVSAAVQLLQSLRDKNIFLLNAFNRVLMAAAERNDVEVSCQVFKDLMMSCGSLNSVSYHNFARAFQKANDSVQLVRFVREVSELAFPESIIVVNRIILAFAECRQIEKALLIFEQIKGLKCKPDLITYNIVIDILGRVGRVNEMLHEFSSMKEVGIAPDFISYNTLINNLRKVGRLDLCLVYFREMDESGIKPDLLTYTALIDSFGRSGNIEESLRLFNNMKLRHIKPSIYIYRSLINNLKKMGKVDLAMTLLEEMNSSLSVLAGPKDFKRKTW